MIGLKKIKLRIPFTLAFLRFSSHLKNLKLSIARQRRRIANLAIKKLHKSFSLCAFVFLQFINTQKLITETFKRKVFDIPINVFTISKFLVAIVPLWLLSTTKIKAQISQDTINLKTVEITAKKPIEQKALSRSEVDTLELKKLQTKSLAELIQATGPIFVKTYGRGSLATVSFRGTASSHTQVNWNGMNINSPMRGDIDFSLIPVYFIDELSLLHGGSSLSRTSGGLGGSIQINNNPDWEKHGDFIYVQDIESFNTFKEFIQIGLGNKQAQFTTRLFHDQSENNFPFHNYGVLPYREDVQENADYRKYGFLHEFYYRWNNKHQVDIRLWGGHHFRNLPQLMSDEGQNRTEYQENEEIKAQLKWKYRSENIKWEVFGAYNNHQLHYFRSSNTEEINFENFNSTSFEKSYMNQLLFQYKYKEILNLESTVDVNYHTVKVRDKSTEIYYNNNRREVFWMGQLNVAFNEKTSAFVILRSELYDETLIPLIPAIGFEYQISKNISVFLNGSRNYHKPTLNDLYWIPGGNPDLKPEDAWSADLGIKTSWSNQGFKLNFHLNTYQSIIDNWIIWQPSSSGAFYWEAINLRKVWARGIESSLKINWNINRNWMLFFSANYTYTRTSNQNALSSVDESRGKQLTYIPIHSGNFSFDLSYKKWNWGLNNQSIGKRYTTSSNVESDFESILNPFSIFNTDLSWKTNIMKLETIWTFRIENLLDTDYMMILWRPMPGRYYAINLQLKWRK
jgi:outer membrane cobalamin receptor